MSFILDALRKSETERQQQGGAEFSSVPTSSGNTQSLKWLWILAALLGVNLAVLAGILLRPDASPEPAPPAETSADPAAVIPESVAPSFEDQVEAAKMAQAERQQASAASATPRTEAPVSEAPTAVAVAPAPSNRVMTIDELRLAGALQMTDLHLDIHVYSENPSERFVFINMSKYREHSRIDEGPVVNEITPEGVVLDYNGMTFLLPRE